MRMNRVMPERICGKGYFPINKQINLIYLFIFVFTNKLSLIFG